MRILSLNAWGGALRDELVAFLADVDADVVCLQEVPRALDARGPWLTYRDGAVEIPQRADLYADVRAALPEHDGRYFPAMRGQLADGDPPCWQEFGLATFARSRLAVTAEAMAFVQARTPPTGSVRTRVHGTPTPSGCSTTARAAPSPSSSCTACARSPARATPLHAPRRPRPSSG